MYAVAAHLPVIEYIPEWLTVMNQDDVDLNVAINDLSLNNEIFNDDLTNHVINQMNEEERLRQQREFDINEQIRLEINSFEKRIDLSGDDKSYIIVGLYSNLKERL